MRKVCLRMNSTLDGKEENDKTQMTMTEYDWTVGQMMEMSKLGVNQCLDKMASSFARA